MKKLFPSCWFKLWSRYLELAPLKSHNHQLFPFQTIDRPTYRIHSIFSRPHPPDNSISTQGPADKILE
ncbi:hypothetical protein L6452_14932 [Arctium lappa]|uniref:Uncharacterized protein n=1 Tax=Arctium lappa TaxID=4217 RepID=A0ACB9CMF2_ARCLA|nr:hypothetical protein L6452_14932 [Arctium lappa]